MNGFEIQITEKDFKAKPEAEQNWILFLGISSLAKCIKDIDSSGCEYARKKQRGYRLKAIAVFGSSFATAAGVIYIIFNLLRHGL